MQFKLAAIFLAIGLVAAVPQDHDLIARQNQNRPVPSGQCCVAETNLKQDACNANGGAGRCVPGGNNCGSALSCVAQSKLACDSGIIERGKSLCRAKAGNGFIDGNKVIQNLNQAKVN
ncbi:hypothetical protein QBC47DRAFT_435376 [Echria macrotheca]|uniref:Uncharacterized protein n=1 Tax=Echria macrotheca TaxID=438768 RepID=A0AAJ0B3H3_9PEZI|nr:hypothetical protein QBC47DRAFT_435376 [Echria macrotheca]